MANIQNIRRLHKSESVKVPALPPVKISDFDNSQPAATPPPAPRERVCGRFRMGRRETACTVDAPGLMSALEAAGPLDRSGAFQALAMRERLSEFARAWRLRERSPNGGSRTAAPLAIQI